MHFSYNDRIKNWRFGQIWVWGHFLWSCNKSWGGKIDGVSG
jgi:hypothetical protein